MTKPVTFKQADLTRAIKGVKATGLPVSRVEVEEGRIVVIVGEPDSPRNRRNPLDRLHAA